VPARCRQVTCPVHQIQADWSRYAERHCVMVNISRRRWSSPASRAPRRTPRPAGPASGGGVAPAGPPGGWRTELCFVGPALAIQHHQQLHAAGPGRVQLQAPSEETRPQPQQRGLAEFATKARLGNLLAGREPHGLQDTHADLSTPTCWPSSAASVTFRDLGLVAGQYYVADPVSLRR